MKTMKAMKAVADLCLIPIGTGSASVSKEIARITELFQSNNKIKSHLSGNGTSLEGEWDDVFAAIKQAHELLHESGIVRVHSDIRVGTRTDKDSGFEQKIESVMKLMQK